MKRFLICVFLGMAAGPKLAWAQEDAFDKVLDEALGHYKARRYDQAARAFGRAYQIRREPELVYNQARAYEKGLRRDESIAMYERFLEMVGTTAQLRAKALISLTALREERVALKKAEASLESLSKPKTTVVTTALSASPKVVEYSLLGVGGLAVSVGAVFAVFAANANRDLSNAKMQFPGDPGRLSDLEDQIRGRALLADVLVGTGAVTMGVGLLMLLLGNDRSESLARVGSVFHGSGAEFAVSGKF